MSALFAALYPDHAAAERVRTALVTEGFPTDRVELSSAQEPGQAAIGPADRRADQLEDYFVQFFDRDDEEDDVRTFVEGVSSGKASIVVHPRGDIETRRALDILQAANPVELREHDIEKQFMERAASPESAPVVKKLLPEQLKPRN
ncbi:MAG: hypothetical protein ABI885_11840 [Gammaproteobacteria bacterium]